MLKKLAITSLLTATASCQPAMAQAYTQSDLARDTAQQDKVEWCAEMDLANNTCDFIFTACGWDYQQDLVAHTFEAPLTKEVCKASR